MSTPSVPSQHAPAIVLLHGANGCQSEMQPWCDALATVGFQASAINLAGHGGRAIPSPLTLGALARDVLGQFDEQGLQQPIVLGYSFGGLVALHLARHHPERVRGVVSLATKYVFDADAVDHFTHLLQVPRLTAMPHRLEHLSRVHQPNDWRELVEALHACFTAFGKQAPLTTVDLQAIQCPTLVLSGTKDQLVSAAETQALFRGLRRGGLAMFDGMAHPAVAVPSAGLAKTVKAWSQREGLF